MEELIPITMFMCIAGVLVLRPISTKVGALLEALTRERMQVQAPSAVTEHQLNRVTLLLEQITRRQELLEERLDFTERLVGSKRRGVSAGARDSIGVFDDVGLGQEPLNSLHR